jgi:hypothetical protein
MLNIHSDLEITFKGKARVSTYLPIGVFQIPSPPGYEDNRIFSVRRATGWTTVSIPTVRRMRIDAPEFVPTTSSPPSSPSSAVTKPTLQSVNVVTPVTELTANAVLELPDAELIQLFVETVADFYPSPSIRLFCAHYRISVLAIFDAIRMVRLDERMRVKIESFIIEKLVREHVPRYALTRVSQTSAPQARDSTRNTKKVEGSKALVVVTDIPPPSIRELATALSRIKDSPALIGASGREIHQTIAALTDTELSEIWKYFATIFSFSQSLFSKTYKINQGNFSRYLSGKKESISSRVAIVNYLIRDL